MNKPVVPVDPQALKRMEEYPFPGNIRELENMIERALVVGNGKKIHWKTFRSEKWLSTSIESLEELREGVYPQILGKYAWNISRAAKALKVDRVTLYNKIRKYGLKSPE